MRVFVALASAFVLPLSACGSSTGASTGSSAGSRTAGGGQPAARPALGVAEATGLVQKRLADAKSVRMTITGTSDGDTLNGEVVISTANMAPEYDIAVVLAGSASNQAMRLLILKSGVYLKTGTYSINPGDPWLKSDPNSKSVAAKLSLVSGMSILRLVDPAEQALTGAAGGKLTAAEPDLGTLHYGIAVDMEAALQKVDLRRYLSGMTEGAQQIPGLDAELLGQADDVAHLSDARLGRLRAKLVAAAKGATFIELWVGPDGLPRRQTIKAGAGRHTQDIAIGYSDWGKAAITPPADDEVVKMPG